MKMINILAILLVLTIAAFIVVRILVARKKEETEEDVEQDDKTYTLEKMIEFVKRRLDEITKINLYDIGLSEEELKRRKNKKYELKKALKGCTYGDVNDKKYVKELIYDLLSKEYGTDETNISKAIPFDIPSLLTAQDKFDILIYIYKQQFGYEALTEFIKKYNMEGQELVLADVDKVKGIKFLQRNLSMIANDCIRHDPNLVATSIIELICDDLKYQDKQNDPQYLMLNTKLREEKRISKVKKSMKKKEKKETKTGRHGKNGIGTSFKGKSKFSNKYSDRIVSIREADANAKKKIQKEKIQKEKEKIEKN